MRVLLAAGLLAVCAPSAASAQPTPEAASRSLRERARGLTRDGELTEAYTCFRRAATGSADPDAWRELAEAADRLRMDERAIEAYGRYLELRPDAPDRVEVAARVRVLRQVLEGARFVDGDADVRVIHDWNGEPSLPSGTVASSGGASGGSGEPAGSGASNVLVDWAGRPLAGRRTRDMLALADWDGVIRGGGPSAPDAPEPPADQGLGRRLAAP